MERVGMPALQETRDKKYFPINEQAYKLLVRL